MKHGCNNIRAQEKAQYILIITNTNANTLYNLLCVVISERMQRKSRDLENPSTVHVTVSTGQVTV